MAPITAAFAEVVNSTHSSWRGLSWHHTTIPCAGSIVATQLEQKTIYGLIETVDIIPAEGSRQVVAYRKEAQTLAEEQPHIFAFLRVEFSCRPIAWADKKTGAMMLLPAMQPPALHSFIREAAPDELEKLLSAGDYIRAVLCGTHNENDALLGAFLQNAYAKIPPTSQRHSLLLDYIATNLAPDFRRIRRICYTLDQLIY
jgi:hypothetical protein